MKLFKGQIVENHLSNGSVIVCRVVDPELSFAPGQARLCDAQETKPDWELIKNSRTWGAPFENIRTHDNDCYTCHKDGLVVLG